jgi:hypothetical protein
MIRIVAITHTVAALISGVTENGERHPLCTLAPGSFDLERIASGHSSGLTSFDSEIAYALLSAEID